VNGRTLIYPRIPVVDLVVEAADIVVGHGRRGFLFTMRVTNGVHLQSKSKDPAFEQLPQAFGGHLQEGKRGRSRCVANSPSVIIGKPRCPVDET